MPKTIVLTLLILSIPIFLNLFLKREIKKQGIPKIKYPYQKKKFLLNIDEKKFFDALSLAVEEEYYIFPKIALTDFLKVEKVDKRKIYKDKLKSREVDFLLCNKENLEPEIAIKLEKVKASQESGVKGDVFLDKTFEAAGIKFLKFNIKSEYDISVIKEKLAIDD